MSRGGDPNILGKVVADSLLAGLLKAEELLPVLKPMVNPPHVKWDVFTEMANDNLQVGVSVKDAVGHHAQDVETDTMGETEGRANQPLPVCPELLIYSSGGVAGVEIKWDVKVGAGLPEYIPLGLVVKDHVVTVFTSALSVIDQGALETIFLNASSELGSGFLGIMHR